MRGAEGRAAGRDRVRRRASRRCSSWSPISSGRSLTDILAVARRDRRPRDPVQGLEAEGQLRAAKASIRPSGDAEVARHSAGDVFLAWLPYIVPGDHSCWCGATRSPRPCSRRHATSCSTGRACTTRSQRVPPVVASARPYAARFTFNWLCGVRHGVPARDRSSSAIRAGACLRASTVAYPRRQCKQLAFSLADDRDRCWVWRT